MLESTLDKTLRLLWVHEGMLSCMPEVEIHRIRWIRKITQMDIKRSRGRRSMISDVKDIETCRGEGFTVANELLRSRPPARRPQKPLKQQSTRTPQHWYIPSCQVFSVQKSVLLDSPVFYCPKRTSKPEVVPSFMKQPWTVSELS